MVPAVATVKIVLARRRVRSLIDLRNDAESTPASVLDDHAVADADDADRPLTLDDGKVAEIVLEHDLRRFLGGSPGQRRGTLLYGTWPG
jgi:hypothetical protein